MLLCHTEHNVSVCAAQLEEYEVVSVPPLSTDSVKLAGGPWAVCVAVWFNACDRRDLHRKCVLRIRSLESQILSPKPPVCSRRSQLWQV